MATVAQDQAPTYLQTPLQLPEFFSLANGVYFIEVAK